MNVAIIPARGGSRRIPRKNIRDFHGKPIIAYSIEKALTCGVFDLVYVSTEDNEIDLVARRYGAETLRRDLALARDEVGTQEVMRSELGYIVSQAVGKSSIEYACCIYPCAPMLSRGDLWRGLEALKQANAWYAFSVLTRPLADAGMFYWGQATSFLEGAFLYGPRSVMIPIPDERGIDINTPEDWARAEAMSAALKP